MICSKCGHQFTVGIFCPECGTKYETPEEEKASREREEQERFAKEKEKAEHLEQERREAEEARKAKEKAEAERLECERKEAEEKRKEAERLAKEKAEADRIERERLEAEQKWKAEEEAVIREDTVRIESLKRRLLSTKKQNERRKMITEFGNPPVTLESRLRYDALKEKAEMEEPKEILICKLYGITVLLTFVGFVVSGIINPEISETALGIGTVIWAGFGVFIWPIWKIVLLVKSKRKNYYLNIKHI